MIRLPSLRADAWTGATHSLRAASRIFPTAPVARVLSSLLFLVVATALLYVLRSHISTVLVAIVYLLVVLAVSLRNDAGVGTTIALLAFLAFDVFFIQPVGQLAIASGTDTIALMSFVVLAIAMVQVVTSLRHRVRMAEVREEFAATLSGYTGLLLADADRSIPSDAVLRETARLLDADRCVVLPVREREQDDVHAARDAGLPEYVDVETVRLVSYLHRPLMFDAGARVGASVRASKTLYVPLLAEERLVAVLVASGRFSDTASARHPVPPTAQAIVRTLAVALDRARLARESTDLAARQRSEEFKTVLLASISHELKTPIATVKASVSGLLGDDAHWEGTSAREVLRTIDDATDRLNRLVTNLLDLSRIEAGQVIPRFDWCDLHDIIANAATDAGPQLSKRNFSIRASETLPLVYADFVLIAKVVTNLLDNALRFTHEAGRIEVIAAASDAAVVVSVFDDGPGIPAAARSRVFERFYQDPAQANDHRSGAGLGLAICHGFVEYHGGKIWVSESPYGGAAFSFSLPLVTRPLVGGDPG